MERPLFLISHLNIQHSVVPIGFFRHLDRPPTRFVVLAVPRYDRRPVHVDCLRKGCRKLATGLPTALKFHLWPVRHIHGEIFVVAEFRAANAASGEGVGSAF